jgi:hypothetical protein
MIPLNNRKESSNGMQGYAMIPKLLFSINASSLSARVAEDVVAVAVDAAAAEPCTSNEQNRR